MSTPPSSRYYGASTYQATTAEGTIVPALVIPAVRSPLPIGYHPRAFGDRLVGQLRLQFAPQGDAFQQGSR